MSKKKGAGTAHELSGVLEITRSGMGFVLTKEKGKDILIKPNDIQKAFDGDTVLVALKKQGNAQRREGVIKEVIQRKQTEFIGSLEVNGKIAFFVPATEKPMPDFYISQKNLNGAVNGDKVIVKLLSWDKADKKPEGKVLSVLDIKNEVDLAMKEILVQNGFSINFPEEVIRESENLSGVILAEEVKKRRDFRDIFTITIDPADAKDFDDAISFRKIEGGNFEVGVHIADVSHFVKPGSALDDEAYKRSCSVYLPDRVVPMLPEKISNELCSLRPKEEKYCFAAVFTITPQGKIVNTWLGRTVICSDHRFAYEEVQEVIEARSETFKVEIDTLNKLARHFRKERFKNGAINFSSVEVRFLLDAEGRPRGIILKESKEAHQLIEEFMLLANKAVANYVEKIKVNGKLLPFPYRIHDTPDEEKLKPFAAFAGKFGYHFDMSDEKAVALSFNQMLEKVEGKPEQHVLEQLGIRTMSKAAYSTENIGHYGLGFKNYCHFTSPIRRYPDVIVHRILAEVLAGEKRVDKTMEKKCGYCSERERAAMEAERASNKFEQVLFMLNKVGEEMEGIISGVSPFGFWVETIEEKCEGMVSVRDLSEYDDFRHDETEYCLTGLRTGKKFRMGDKVKVKLVAANPEKRQLDFEWVSEKKNAAKKPESAGKSKKKK